MIKILSWRTNIILFLTALSVVFCALFLEEKTGGLLHENKKHLTLLTSLQNLQNPDKYSARLQQPQSRFPLQTFLKKTSPSYFIHLEKIQHISKNHIEFSFKTDLDTDVFDYLEHLQKNYPNTLSIQEIGLFRDHDHVVGKIILQEFKHD